MYTHHPSRVIAGAALLALVISFVAPFPVLAEESPPPAESAVEATPMPADELPVADGAPVEPIPPEAPSGDEAPGDAAAPAASGLADLLAAVPDGTTLAVVDDAGELLPLVSAQAAEVIAGGDPMWCPASLSAPTPGANGCTASHSSFGDLVTELIGAQPAVDGIIWIADDYTAAGEGGLAEIPGSTLSTMALYKLTLRGGWDGVSGSKLISGTSLFNGARLVISNWMNDVALTDIEIANAPAGNALDITTTGNITLTRVNSHDNSGTGAFLDNRHTSAKAVTVSSSQFESNGDQGGLSVHSNGKITLASVIASHNDTQAGAYLDNTYATEGAPQPVVLTGLNRFNDNGTAGLLIYSDGAITAIDLTATGNLDGYGVMILNQSASTAQAVTLTGTNVFASNSDGGLYVRSRGAIKLNSLFAASNGGVGVQLLNTDALSDQPLTLTGTNVFSHNTGRGLDIFSRGAVTLNNVSASGSATSRGVSIDNTASTTRAAVKLTGVNTFNDNWTTGLAVYSHGLIQAANVTALGNGVGLGSGYGAYLTNDYVGSTAGVTLSGSSNLSGNLNHGLYLRSRGPALVNNLTASNNGQYGADLDNRAALTPQKVTFTGKNVFSGNSGYGLRLYSNGAIVVSNLTATDNGTSGGGSQGAALDNSSAPTPQPVTLSGVNQLQGNGLSGLAVYSLGAITISSLTATGNGFTAGGSGAVLSNSTLGLAIKLTGTNLLSGNHTNGLLATSQGAITIANLTASNNANGYGADLYNGTTSDLAPQKVTLTGTGALSDNLYRGLSIWSSGAVSVGSLTASGNGWEGASIQNTAAGVDGSAQPVTLSGSYTFNDNGSHGLNILSYGLVKVNNLTASGNSGVGAAVDNNYANRTGGITLSGRNAFLDNESAGLALSSLGPILASYLTASGNGTSPGGGGGVFINNASAVTAQPVKLTGVNLFSSNRNEGLYILSAGAVTLSSVSASGSQQSSGALIYNDTAPSAQPVTLTGTSTFDDNYSQGLWVQSLGAINLSTTRLEASGNGGAGSGWGIHLENHNALTPQKITLKGPVIAIGNDYTGLAIFSKGAITVNNLTASENAGSGGGAHLKNDYAGALGGVTLGGSNSLQDNARAGLSINSSGPVTVNNLTSTGNGNAAGDNGITIYNNTSPATPQAVKLTGVNNLSGNYGYGLSVVSTGAISLNSVTANDSAIGLGAYLSNTDAGSVGGITLTGTNTFNGNYFSGLQASSLGAITVNNLTASGNGSLASTFGLGALLDNSTAATPQAVKLTGSNTFTENWDAGLEVYSVGAIAANNLTVKRNGQDGSSNGAYLKNFDAPAPQNVTLTGSNSFTENDSYGLLINSAGVVTLSKIVADGNGNSGLSFVNSASSITLTCASFIDNGGSGAFLWTTGLLRLVGVVAAGTDLSIAGPPLEIQIVRTCPLG